MEGADIKVAEMLYTVMVQAVILFGLEPWVLSKAMYKMVEGACARFLQQITEKWALRNTGGMWVTTAEGKVR